MNRCFTKKVFAGVLIFTLSLAVALNTISADTALASPESALTDAPTETLSADTQTDETSDQAAQGQAPSENDDTNTKDTAPSDPSDPSNPSNPSASSDPSNPSDTTISGAYILQSTLDSNLVVEVADARGTNGASIQLGQKNGSLAQAFALNYNEKTGYYTLVNYASGRVIDVAGGSTDEETPLQQYTSNNTAAQHWQLVSNTNGTVTFLSVLSGYAMDVSGGSASVGARLQQYTSNKTAAQCFVLIPTTPVFSGGIVSIKPSDNLDLLLDVQDDKRSAGATAQLQTYNGGLAQKFKLSNTGNNLFHIDALNSGLRLSVNEKGVVSFENAGTLGFSQLWRIVATDDGHFSIQASSTDATLAPLNKTAALERIGAQEQSAFSWNLVSVPMLADGYYTISPKNDTSLALDVDLMTQLDYAHDELVS